MKIVVFGTFYSEGMGYAENCLPKALANLGHEVHLVTSNLNVYGDSEIYEKTYKTFLGPANQSVGEFFIDGYTVHRLPSTNIFGYVYVQSLFDKIRMLSPDIVHSTEICSLNTFFLTILKPFFRFKLFTETHQHLSVIKPYLKEPGRYFLKKLLYKLTRTLPTYITSLFVEKCYAIAPDCAYVANKYYGVPKHKIIMQSLGTDTDLFKPATSDEGLRKRKEMRKQLGYSEEDIVCIYTGRFSDDKNPLLLAKAIEKISLSHEHFFGLFIGEGIQKDLIKSCQNVQVKPFMKHKDLAEYYKLADIAIWPTQESMSMLDAAASGLPLVVSNKIGEVNRIDGNGEMFEENNVESLSNSLLKLSNKDIRTKLSKFGRKKMEKNFSWNNIALNIESDYKSC
jgi:glycosyltransferase involved in cell wall biosynthesis